uniref:Uncharacterized protein n=1 Tax=Cannabis sativa TaxID=3483 RepID=A0A803PCK1_CANSA
MVRTRAISLATTTDENSSMVDAPMAPPPSTTFVEIPPRIGAPMAPPPVLRSTPIDRPTYEDVRSPYYLSTADHSNLALVTPILTDQNFQP